MTTEKLRAAIQQHKIDGHLGPVFDAITELFEEILSERAADPSTVTLKRGPGGKFERAK